MAYLDGRGRQTIRLTRIVRGLRLRTGPRSQRAHIEIICDETVESGRGSSGPRHLRRRVRRELGVQRGRERGEAGNLDEAVAAYRRAVQADPRNPNYAIALQRTMVAASRAHLDRAKEFEDRDQLEAALGEYRLASEFDPSNRTVGAKVAELEQTIRDRIEAARPRPAIEALRAQARAASPNRSSIPRRAIR